MNTIIDRENIINLLLSTLEVHFDEIKVLADYILEVVNEDSNG